MKAFQDLVTHVLETGTLYSNGKGKCHGVIGAQVSYDISNNLPAVTGKKTNIAWAIAEMCMFIKGISHIDFLKPYGAEKIWEGQSLSEDLIVPSPRAPMDVVEEYAQKTGVTEEEAKNFLVTRTTEYQQRLVALSTKIPTNGKELSEEEMIGLLSEEEYHAEVAKLNEWIEQPFVDLGISLRSDRVVMSKGSLGPIYGTQWRKWKAVAPNNRVVEIDQLAECIEKLKQTPTTRQAILSSWNPAAIVNENIAYDDKIKAGFMGQPPCHVMYHFLGRENDQGEMVLNTTLWLRSNDLMLGHPFNAVGATVLTHLLANQLGWKVGKLVMQISDAHLYEEHVEGAKEYVQRPIHPTPTFNLPPEVTLTNFTVEDVLAAVGEYTHEPYMPFGLKTRVNATTETTQEQADVE